MISRPPTTAQAPKHKLRYHDISFDITNNDIGGAAPPPVLPPAPVPGEGVSPLGVPPSAGEPFRCFFHTFKMPGYETSECSLGLGETRACQSGKIRY